MNANMRSEWDGICADLASEYDKERRLARDWQSEVEALQRNSPHYLAWLWQRVANLERELELLHEVVEQPHASRDGTVWTLIRVARGRLHSYLNDYVWLTEPQREGTDDER